MEPTVKHGEGLQHKFLLKQREKIFKENKLLYQRFKES